MTHKPKLLIIEDDLGLCSQYRWAFPQCEVLFAHHREQAFDIAKRERPPVVLMDLGLPPDPDGVSEGFLILDGLVRMSRNTKIVVVTSHHDRQHALRAVGAGAYDFCDKPVDIQVLGTIVQRAQTLFNLEEENRRLTDAIGPSPIQNIITANDGMLKVCRNVDKLASANVPVLLLGESGTGKEALARALHDLGPRAKHPFVAINCGAIPENLLESELFGHERGAFTGAVKQSIGRVELAHRGTLFLDEIGDLPSTLQVKLLRFLQDQLVQRIGGRTSIQVDVRVVSATNQRLANQVDSGDFRGDLFYRLNPITLTIPPLRERGEDPILLSRYFLARYSREYSKSFRGFADDALSAIVAYQWPGNIRELENKIKRAVLMADTKLISAEDLELPNGGIEVPFLDLRRARAAAEREAVQRALTRSDGQMSAAARLLGISRPTLYALLDAHNLAPGNLDARAPSDVDPSQLEE